MSHLYMILFLVAVLLFSCQQPSIETLPIRQDIIETIFASGVLEAENTYNLTALNDGYLVEVNFKEGDFVKKGQIIAVIENRENALNAESASNLYNFALKNAQSNAPALLQAQTSVANAKQKLEQDRIQEQRYKRLLESNSIARNEYETALLNFQTSSNNYESAVLAVKKLEQDVQQQTISPKNQQRINEITLGKNTIRAVEKGKVYQKLKSVGDFVRRGDVIATIGDPDFIYAKVKVDESSISKVKVGQTALVKLNAQKEKAYEAKVLEILPSFDENQQSFICKLKFSEKLDFAIVKTQLQSNITIDTQRNALLIPRNFLEYGGFVYVKNGKEREKVKVETNFISSDWVQILSGIDEKSVLTTHNIEGSSKGNTMPQSEL
jgi:multidrug efflux pump subunit AcrA (membrane-fusion protein)